MTRNIQNEIIQTMANQITRDIRANIRNNLYSIICNEYTDVSNKEIEQTVIVLHTLG